VRSLFAAIGLVGSALLAWLGMWLWAPLPFASFLLLHEVIFWARGDRAMTVTLHGTTVTLLDPKNGRTQSLDLSAVEWIGVGVRAGDGDNEDVFLVFHGPRGPLFALRLENPRREWHTGVARLDALQPVLGGNAGIVRGLAPPDTICRQTVLDPDGQMTRAFLALADNKDQVIVRAWRGVAPPADFLGLHRGPPDVLLTLAPSRWTTWDRFTDETRTGTLDGTRGGRASRAVELLDLPGADAARAKLPLMVLELGDGLRLAIPAPLAGHHGDEVSTDEQTLHTHLGEGALLVWWLIRHLPSQQLAPPLLRAVADARVAGPLHAELARHVQAP
jgi:hypothetical protein